MIGPEDFFRQLTIAGISSYVGVPDSLLKSFCAYVTDRVPKERHMIAANEGGAIALAAGYFLASGEPALVYFQNSGLGNAINPLLSLADPEVYSIPMLLLIGWRGKPGTADEPQHIKQGRVTLSLLDALEVPYVVLGPDSDPKAVVEHSVGRMKERMGPAAILVEPGSFAPYRSGPKTGLLPLTREEAIGLILDELDERDRIVATTGMASRELFELREARGEGHEKDFLTVGSMGHSSQIALALAAARPERRFVCLDGDGALLMHMGGLALIADRGPANFVHIVINNGVHDSVGGQPTAGPNVDFVSLALALGYRLAYRAANAEEVKRGIRQVLGEDGPSLLEIRVRSGARPDLGRPTTSPIDNRDQFMKGLH